MILKALPFVLAVSLASCTSASQDICQASTDHLADCLGVETLSDNSNGVCDEEKAQAVLDTECKDFNSDKADILSFLDDYDNVKWLGDTYLCWRGWLSHCEMPECEQKLVSESSCADYLTLDGCGACDYYDCREEESVGQCGDSGYYKEYGAKNCRLLTLLTQPKLSPRGQGWLNDTRNCLLRYAEYEIDVEEPICSNILEEAMASHVGCYVNPNGDGSDGFCEISLLDQRILIKSIELKDLDAKTMIKTKIECAKKLVRKIKKKGNK